MKAFSITDVGMKRKVNQDYVFCEENAIGSLPNLFIVADGMGGHKAGDFASRHCVNTVVEKIRSSTAKTPVTIIEEAIQTANISLAELSATHTEYEGMGTTFVGITIIGSNVYVANIGDSRAYLINEHIRQITEDHSLVEAMVKNGGLERKDVKSHPNKNIITRALGTNRVVSADFFEVPIKENDIILLCSDGLSNMLEDEEIFETVAQRNTNVDQIAKELIRKANANGGKDNIAVVLVQI